MKFRNILLLVIVLLTACTSSGGAFPTRTPPAPDSPTLSVNTLPTQTLQPVMPDVFAASPPGEKMERDPLTGMDVKSANLERRPILIKVENLPRMNRPQWGLNAADLVFEYYTEEGTTRFAALFYGQDSEQVAPIRSARFFDMQLVHMYKAMFIFGSAYDDLLKALFASDFKDRLILEQPGSCPALCRFDPGGHNILMANTSALQKYFTDLGFDNTRQDLAGMQFSTQPPEGGDPSSQLFVRFSGAIYNRWDFDPASGRYLRFVDAEDDLNRTKEVYAPLVDRRTNEQIAMDNVVILLTDYVPVVLTKTSEVYDIPLQDKGWAYVLRDGKIYQADWVREKPDGILKLNLPDGSAFPLRPGRTWFEVLNRSSIWDNKDGVWRFNFRLP
jgi:hypothetical protein